MPDTGLEPTLVDLQPQPCVVLRERVPMGEMTSFFSRAFHLTGAAAGPHIGGPPLGIYFGMPSDTVDVAAGFPVHSAVEPSGEVVAYTLPGGRAAQYTHLGSYDSLAQSYDRLMTWMRERDLTPADVMWESYLNEPQPDHPESARTLITWPVA